VRRGRARGNAASSLPDIDLDHHVEGAACGGRGFRQPRDRRLVVGNDRELDAPHERCQALQLAAAHDRRGDQHIADAAGTEHLGLGKLGAAHPDCAGLLLHARYDRTLVALGVRANALRLTRRQGRERRYIGFQRRGVDQQGRRVELSDGAAELSGATPEFHGRSCLQPWSCER
jgi:hypothetical protein